MSNKKIHKGGNETGPEPKRIEIWPESDDVLNGIHRETAGDISNALREVRTVEMRVWKKNGGAQFEIQTPDLGSLEFYVTSEQMDDPAFISSWLPLTPALGGVEATADLKEWIHMNYPGTLFFHTPGNPGRNRNISGDYFDGYEGTADIYLEKKEDGTVQYPEQLLRLAKQSA